jgi:hypothetical protein
LGDTQVRDVVDEICDDIPTPFSAVFSVPIIPIELAPAASADVGLEDIFYKPSLYAAAAKDEILNGTSQ